MSVEHDPLWYEEMKPVSPSMMDTPWSTCGVVYDAVKLILPGVSAVRRITMSLAG